MPTATQLAKRSLHRRVTRDPIAPLNLREAAEITRLERENEIWRRISGITLGNEPYMDLKERRAGIKTFALYHEFARKLTDVKALAKKNIHIRFWDAEPYDAQILLYGDNVVINTFDDSVFTTVITDPTIAKTMRVIFNEAWKNSKV